MEAQDIEQFCDLSTKLIAELGMYAAETEKHEDHSAHVRRLRTVAAALLSALDQVRMMPVPQPVPPPGPVMPPMMSVPTMPAPAAPPPAAQR